MKLDVLRRPASMLGFGLLVWVACGGEPGAGFAPTEERLGTQEAALCSGGSVSTLNILGASTYQGELAGSGSWAASAPANAVRLDYYVDGVLRSSDERTSASGSSWYFSTTGVSCGVTHVFEARAYPMIIDSTGNRTICWDTPRSVTQNVYENCPAATMSASAYHTAALARDGSVWAWGSNMFGAIGDGTTTDRATPVRVAGINNVKAIDVGSYHTVALKQDGTVWTWGYNSSGQLGNGTTTNQYTPAMVPGLGNVIAISAGGSFSLAVKQDGTVWAWGDNWCGPLGDGTETRRLAPVQVVGLTGVKAVAAGTNHSVALKQDGTVWAWGRNTWGSVGDGTTTGVRTSPVRVLGLTNVKSIAATYWHSLAVKQDGTLWGWGDNRSGQLGDGTLTDRFSPVQAMGLGSVAAVDGGYCFTTALKQDGTVWTWGYNNYGQLGTGTTTNRSIPGQVAGLSGITSIVGGQSHTGVVKPDGSAWAWGYGSGNYLGNGTTGQSLTPVRVVGLGP